MKYINKKKLIQIYKTKGLKAAIKLVNNKSKSSSIFRNTDSIQVGPNIVVRKSSKLADYTIEIDSQPGKLPGPECVEIYANINDVEADIGVNLSAGDVVYVTSESEFYIITSNLQAVISSNITEDGGNVTLIYPNISAVEDDIDVPIGTPLGVETSYSGSNTTVTAPAKAGILSFEAWGGGGGGGYVSRGGGGAYVSGTLPVTGNITYDIYVGGGGAKGSTGVGGAGGTNGGGDGNMVNTYKGGGGGGYSGFFSGSTPLFIAAGGGGGGNPASSLRNNGGGGGAASGIGQAGANVTSPNNAGQGGTQVAGGAGGFGNPATLTGSSGSYLQGGLGWQSNNNYGAGGGGGGFYGGGGGGIVSLNGGGGGGGSSYIITDATNTSSLSGNLDVAGGSPPSGFAQGGNASESTSGEAGEPGLVKILFYASGEGGSLATGTVVYVESESAFYVVTPTYEVVKTTDVT